MRYKLSFISIALLSSCLMLTACSQPQTSAERHAKQYINAVTDDFDPNFHTNKADSTRRMVPFFTYFYDAGTEDRISGVSRQQALLQVEAFRSEEFLKSIKSKETFAGRTYTNSNHKSEKQLKALSDAITETYMDGYEGAK
ncbi:Exc2 family lipoprotein [Enterobacter mori]